MLFIPDVLDQVVRHSFPDNTLQTAYASHPDAVAQLLIVVTAVTHRGELGNEEVIATMVRGCVFLDVGEFNELWRIKNKDMMIQF